MTPAAASPPTSSAGRHRPSAATVVPGAGAPDGPRRLEQVDVVRGLLVLAVVVGHVAYLLSWHIGEPAAVPALSALLQPVRMPALFLLSGALFAPSLLRPWSGVLRRRVLPLVWVLVVWLFVEALVRSTIGVLPSYRPGVLLAYVGQQLWLPDDYLWFIWALVVMTVVARLLRHRWLLVLVGSGLLWSASTPLPEILELGKQAGSFLRTSPLFLVGAAASPVLRTTPRSVLLALPVAVAVFVVHCVAPEIEEALPGRVAQGWLLLVAAAGLVCLLALATVLMRTPLGRVLSAAGRRTLALYLVHMPVTLLTVWFAATYLREGAARFPTTVTALVFVLAVVLALLLPAVLDRLGLGGVLGLPRWLARRLEPAADVVPSAMASRGSPPPGAGRDHRRAVAGSAGLD